MTNHQRQIRPSQLQIEIMIQFNPAKPQEKSKASYFTKVKYKVLFPYKTL